jgi:hypothetical protein
LTDFGKIVSIINKYGETTLEIFENFKTSIIEPNYSTSDDDVDVILSTIHGAKGMEWDNVQVFATSMGSFNSRLDKYTIHDGAHSKGGFQRASNVIKTSTDSSIARSEINYQNFGDGLNLWYVALTRAKKVLSVPPELMALIQDFGYMLKSQHPVRNPAQDVNNSVEKRIKLESEVEIFSVDGAEWKEEEEVAMEEAQLDDEKEEETDEKEKIEEKKEEMEEEAPPRLFYLNGKVQREASSSELKSLHRHLAQPWAGEMMAAAGGLFIDQENVLEGWPYSNSSSGNGSGSSGSSGSGQNQQQHCSPAACNSSSSTTSNMTLSPGQLSSQQHTHTPPSTGTSVSSSPTSSISGVYGMCYFCKQKSDHYSRTCPNRT